MALAAIHPPSHQFPSNTVSTSVFMLSPHRPISVWKNTHLLSQLNKIIIMRRITRRQQISDKENNQNQFNNRSNRIILIARLNITNEHGRARHLLKSRCDLVHGRDHSRLNILKVHLDKHEGSRNVCNKRRKSNIEYKGRLVEKTPASVRTAIKMLACLMIVIATCCLSASRNLMSDNSSDVAPGT